MATNSKSKSTTKGKTSTKKSNSTKPSKRNNPAISRSTPQKKTSGVRKRSGSNKSSQSTHSIDYSEILFWITLGISAFILVSNFGFCGKYGKAVSSLVMSLFGIVGYFIPFIVVFAVAICLKKIKDVKAFSKFVCALILLVLISTLIELLFAQGGTVGNILVSLLKPRIGKFGTFIAVIIFMIIDYILIFETSAVNDMKKAGSKGKKAYTQSKQAYTQAKTKIAEKAEQIQNDPDKPLRRRDRKAENKGLTFNIGLPENPQSHTLSQDELFQNPFTDNQKKESDFTVTQEYSTADDPDVIQDIPLSDKSVAQDIPAAKEEAISQDRPVLKAVTETEELLPDDGIKKTPSKKKNTKKTKQEILEEAKAVEASIAEDKSVSDVKVNSMEQMKIRILPPLDLLKEGSYRSTAGSTSSINTMKNELVKTLTTFGVDLSPLENGNDVDVTPGPSVTRFEFRPAPGVKVAKILSLQDDIKLSLAVSDIRIEAPIPGKAAVGIEVPNKEKSSVLLRDLLDTKEFESSKSKVTYAVGKDIGGNTIISDIAKMPHLLIAGATGSGKSVFINTLIMSILYKATPDEVKFIMIDPKVVELSVYNNLPHLLIPVVTDPKKAAGALNWAVAEMTKRYQAFAREGVRDIKSFNAKCILPVENPEDPKLEKMTQIVVIVDELADLMMVAPKDVEEAICRLAQLARAAGIHLVLATQRPSVNVITGLIKANMPSRIALSVTSGIDSRTIIDMNGAEKLLGNGDMLFYPTGYTKPVRIQGAYVSDEEIQRVVAYIKEHNAESISSQEITDAIENHTIGGNMAVAIGNSDNNERDSYFAEAGRLIIDKDKASIGMLQRQFKIGFNRAARIMDQLHEAGIVGPEEGTKPRKILMNASEFEQYLLDN